MPTHLQSVLRRYFNPLPPHGGRRALYVSFSITKHISIHSLHTEGDSVRHRKFRRSVHFNPLPPHGGRRLGFTTIYTLSHFNPLPPHGGRRLYLPQRGRLCNISIHSLHTEGDSVPAGHIRIYSNFNPLPPHGGRPHAFPSLALDLIFQSTPSTRRETGLAADTVDDHVISIHSLHTEGDNAR